MDWIHLAQDTDQRQTPEQGNKSSGFQKMQGISGVAE
jgi:hypothetical protein